MKLFYDTETTGKADFRAHPDAPQQPRLVQLAAMLCDDSGDEIHSISAIVKPDGFEIPAEASSIHGITQAQALAVGLAEAAVLHMFDQMLMVSSETVAHNIDFDRIIMSRGSDIRRQKLDANRFCTMHAMTEICKLPGRYGFKWPKLSEAYLHCFGKELVGAHDAMADVRACKEVYFWLQKWNAGVAKATGETCPQPTTA